MCFVYDRLFIGVQGGFQGCGQEACPAVRGAVLGAACSAVRVTESQPRLPLQWGQPLPGQMGTHFFSFPEPWDEQGRLHRSCVVLSNGDEWRPAAGVHGTSADVPQEEAGKTVLGPHEPGGPRGRVGRGHGARGPAALRPRAGKSDVGLSRFSAIRKKRTARWLRQGSVAA